jgi:splicing factor U2AF subunit
MAEFDERYEGNGGPAAAADAAGAYAQPEYATAPSPAAGGSPPAGANNPTGFSDHADGRSSQTQVRARAAPIWFATLRLPTSW